MLRCFSFAVARMNNIFVAKVKVKSKSSGEEFVGPTEAGYRFPDKSARAAASTVNDEL
jgi:hypothetical protein